MDLNLIRQSILKKVQDIGQSFTQPNRAQGIGTNQPNFQPYINAYNSAPKPVQNVANFAAKTVSDIPLLSPFGGVPGRIGPTVGQYAQGQIFKPIQNVINPNKSLLEKAPNAVQAGFSATPGGALYNSLVGTGTGILEGIRTHQPIATTIKKDIAEGGGPASKGLGVPGFVGVVGDIALTSNPKSIISLAKSSKNIIKGLKGVNPQAFDLHPDDAYELEVIGQKLLSKAPLNKQEYNTLERSFARLFPNINLEKTSNNKIQQIIAATLDRYNGIKGAEASAFPAMGVVPNNVVDNFQSKSENILGGISPISNRGSISTSTNKGSSLTKLPKQSESSSLNSITEPVNPLISQTETKGQQILPKIKVPELNGESQGLKISPEIQAGGQGGNNIKSSAQASSGIISNVKNKVNQLYTQSLDRFHPISMLGKKAGKDVEMRRALTGYYGSGSTAQYHVDYELGPILQSTNVDDLRNAAIAQRDAELARRGIQGSNKNLTVNITPQTQEALNKLYSYQDNLVQEYLVKTGIMSPESYAAMKANNQNYVPFKRVMDTVDEYLGGTPQTRGAGSVGSQNVIKNIKGSSRDIQDPLESIVENTYKIVGLGKRNEVARTIVNLKDKLPEGMVTKVTGTPLNSRDIISLFENGKVQKYKVPFEVAEAAKGMSEDQMSMIVNILAAPTRVFRATATGINPEFAIPNVTRDLQSAFVNIGVNPLNWVSGLAHMIKRDDVYQEFLKSGGMTSRISLDRPYLKKTVSELAAKGALNKGIQVTKPSKLYGLLEALGQYSEQPTRIASFQKGLKDSLKKGIAREDALKDAAYAAQEGTVNFARRGSKTQSLNAIFAFLNARAQGVDRLVRSVKNDPTAAVRLGLISVSPAIATYAWNRQFPSYNDERVVPQYVKDNNFVIMLSDKPISGLGGAQYITIPKGEVGKLGNPIEAFMKYAEGKGGDVGASLGTVLSAFSPVSNIGDVIPTAIRPPVENAANYNFFYQRPIVAESKKNYPKEYQTSKSTPAIYNWLGQKTNQSPNMIQNLVRGYGTGIARIGEQLSQPFANKDNYSGSDVNQTPIIRRFLQGETRSQDEQTQIDSYKLNDITNKIQDIKTGIKYGNIPMDAGMNEINKLIKQQEQEVKKQSYFGPQSASAATETPKNDFAKKIKDDQAKLDVELHGGIKQLSNGSYAYKNSNGNVSTLDLNPPTKGEGIDAYTNSNWNVSKAVSVYGNKDIPQALKKKAYDTLGVNTEDIQYAYKAGKSNDIKTQYILGQNYDHNTLINELVAGRVESVTNNQFASDGVIENLYDKDLISKEERNALKKIKIDKQGQNLNRVSEGKGRKISLQKKPTGTKIKMPSYKNVTRVKASTPPKLKMPKVSFETPFTPNMSVPTVPNFKAKIKFNV